MFTGYSACASSDRAPVEDSMEEFSTYATPQQLKKSSAFEGFITDNPHHRFDWNCEDSTGWISTVLAAMAASAPAPAPTPVPAPEPAAAPAPAPAPASPPSSGGGSGAEEDSADEEPVIPVVAPAPAGGGGSGGEPAPEVEVLPIPAPAAGGGGSGREAAPEVEFLPTPALKQQFEKIGRDGEGTLEEDLNIFLAAVGIPPKSLIGWDTFAPAFHVYLGFKIRSEATSTPRPLSWGDTSTLARELTDLYQDVSDFYASLGDLKKTEKGIKNSTAGGYWPDTVTTPVRFLRALRFAVQPVTVKEVRGFAGIVGLEMCHEDDPDAKIVPAMEFIGKRFRDPRTKKNHLDITLAKNPFHFVRMILSNKALFTRIARPEAPGVTVHSIGKGFIKTRKTASSRGGGGGGGGRSSSSRRK